MYSLTFPENDKHDSKIIIIVMIALIWANVKAKKDSENIYDLVKRHLCIRNKVQRTFNLLTGSPCFPGSPIFPGFPEMPSAPWYPCMPFGPGSPGSPLIIKNYLDYREMLYRYLNDKYFYTY